MVGRLIAYVRGLWRRRRAAEELADELQHHLTMATEMNRARGLSLDEARREALRDFGGVAQAREAAEELRRPWLERMAGGLWQDVRYSVRMLRRSPGFVAVAILVLALGIGVNTAVFSIVDAVFFRPLAVADPGSLVYLYQVTPNGAWITSHRDVEFFTQHSEAFVGLTDHWGTSYPVLSADGDSERAAGEIVEANYFDLLGVSAQLGRTFLPNEDRRSTPQLAVVISDDFWTRRFARTEDILGRQIRLDDKVFTIVGVMRPGFTGLNSPWMPTQYWVTSAQFFGDPLSRGTGVIARLRPGVSLAQARAIVAVESRQLQIDQRSSYRTPDGWRPRPYLVLPAADVRTPFFPGAQLVPARLARAVGIVVAVVLLIAAANIAGILMARGVARASELAVRQALGVNASRLVRQLLTETVLLSSAGGAVGLFIAWLLVAFYRAYTPARFVVDVSVDARVLLFTALVCLVAGLVVGLAPARQALKIDVIAALGGGAGASAPKRTRTRLRHGIVIPQVALAIVLLLVAGVHVRALAHIETGNLGYRIDGAVVLQVGSWDPSDKPQARYPDAASREADTAARADRSRVFYREVYEHVRDLSGVAAVGLTDRLPVSASAPSDLDTYVGRDVAAGPSDPSVPASTADVSPGYFRAMGLTVQRGRDFDDRDTRDAPSVAIVSEAFAKHLWSGGSALGRFIAAYSPDKPDAKVEWREVVGIVNEVDPILHDVGQRPCVYVPLGQLWQVGGLQAVAWTPGGLAPALPSIKRALVGAGPFAEITRVQTMGQVAAEILYPRRAAAGILAASGLVGVLLAAIGLYGVVSYSVAQRLREIGIRATLGAGRRDLVALVLREAGIVAATASLPGIGLGVIGLRLTSNLVGPVPTADVETFLTVPLLMAVVILLACYLPARRAARVDPMVVLRGL